MADRIIRDELLESERWLGLRDNTARVCYLTLILRADAMGNIEAHVPRLVRMWRDYGVATAAAVDGTLEELANHDLVRMYEATLDGVIHRYIHIPRSRNNLRYVKRVFPLSPWTTDEQIQRLKEKSPGERITITGRALGAHGRGVDVDVCIKGFDVGVGLCQPGAVDKSVAQPGKRQNLFLKKLENLTPEQRAQEIAELETCIAECETTGKTELAAEMKGKVEALRMAGSKAA